MDDLLHTIGLILCIFVLWFMWSPESLSKAYRTVFDQECSMPVEPLGRPLEGL